MFPYKYAIANTDAPQIAPNSVGCEIAHDVSDKNVLRPSSKVNSTHVSQVISEWSGYLPSEVMLGRESAMALEQNSSE